MPALKEYAETYRESIEPMPAKRNRHVAFSHRGSMHVDSNRRKIDLLDASPTTTAGSKRAQSNPRGSGKVSRFGERSELSRQFTTETGPATTPMDQYFKLPSLKTTQGPTNVPTGGTTTPKDGHVINMDAAKKSAKKKPFVRRGLSVNTQGSGL